MIIGWGDVSWDNKHPEPRAVGWAAAVGGRTGAQWRLACAAHGACCEHLAASTCCEHLLPRGAAGEFSM